jgi:hypothetical protein
MNIRYRNTLQDYIKRTEKKLDNPHDVDQLAGGMLGFIALLLVLVVGLWWLTFPENVDWLFAFLGIA